MGTRLHLNGDKPFDSKAPLLDTLSVDINPKKMFSNLRMNDRYELVYGKTRVMAGQNRIMIDPGWIGRDHFKEASIATEDMTEEVA